MASERVKQIPAHRIHTTAEECLLFQLREEFYLRESFLMYLRMKNTVVSC